MREPQQRRHPHNLALSIRPKAGSRYAFLVRGMELNAEYSEFDPWTGPEHIHDGLTRHEQVRRTRRNAARMALQAPFEEVVVNWLVAMGMPRERLAMPYTRRVEATIAILAEPLFEQMRWCEWNGRGLALRAPPHVRARALVRMVCPGATRLAHAAFLNHGAATGVGSLTRDHLDRADKAYQRHMLGLGARDIIEAVLDYDVGELVALERIYRRALQRRDVGHLRGVALAEAIHAKFDLALLAEDRMPGRFIQPSRQAA